MKSFVSLVCVCLSLSGCNSAEVIPSSTGVDVPVTRLRTEPYSFAFYSGLREPARLVIRDQETWRSTWAKIYERGSEKPALPIIDFDNEVVIVAALGERGSSGYSVVFTGATQNNRGGIDVAVRSSEPGDNCGVLGVLTQPVDVARVPKPAGQIRFVEQNAVRDCR